MSLSDAKVPYKLPAVSTCLAYEESAYAWKQHLTKAFAATSLLQMKAWHSNTLMPVVLLRIAANKGGCTGFGVRANGESNGRNLGLGLWRVFFSGTRTYLKQNLNQIPPCFCFLKRKMSLQSITIYVESKTQLAEHYGIY